MRALEWIPLSSPALLLAKVEAFVAVEEEEFDDLNSSDDSGALTTTQVRLGRPVNYRFMWMRVRY